MVTLKDILVRRYGYGRDDFGAAGLVRVDCEEGFLCPVPMHDIFTPHRIDPAKVVRLADLFAARQRVTLKAVGHAPILRFAVLASAAEGLTVAEDGTDTPSFLPWRRLRHGLMRPELLVFEGQTPPERDRPGQSENSAKSLCTRPRLAL